MLKKIIKKEETKEVDKQKGELTKFLTSRMHQCFEREPQAYSMAAVEKLAEDIIKLIK